MRNRVSATIVVSLTLCLLLFGVVGYAFVVGREQGRKALDSTMGEVRLSLMVADSLSEEGRGELERLVMANAEVERTVFISKDEARAEFERSIGHKMKMGVDLPSSIEVCYRGGSAVTARLLSRFTQFEGVREVVCDPSIATRRDTLENSLLLVTIILTTFVGLVVLVLLYFVVGAWVREWQADRRSLIRASLNAGAIAGVVGGALLFLAGQYFEAEMPSLALGVSRVMLVVSMMVVGGVVLSTLFTYMSIKTIQK